MKKEIYLIRHGRTEYNKLGIWQGSGVDSSLDDEGRMQADCFFQRYKDIDFDLVIHSELKRSKETVQAFFNKGIEVYERSTINEISWGKFEGYPHTQESLDTYQSVTEAWSKEEYDTGFPGGESAADLHSRLQEFIEEIKKLTYKKILICSHGRAIRGLMCVMQELPMKDMEKFDHANTGLFHSRYDGLNFNFTMLNNTDHL